MAESPDVELAKQIKERVEHFELRQELKHPKFGLGLVIGIDYQPPGKICFRFNKAPAQEPKVKWLDVQWCIDYLLNNPDDDDTFAPGLDSVGSDLDAYRQLCKLTSVYPEAGTRSMKEFSYLVMGMAGEAGEVANITKKLMRDDVQSMKPEHLRTEVYADLVLEIGDVLWYATQIMTVLGVDASYVMEKNILKLHDRYKHVVAERKERAHGS